jgi:coenzyme F420-0:L-glutamate ligase/coenzyme F420-1:gamma-L-glutamate ligase
MLSYVGQPDSHGNMLHTTEIAVADELAATAELVTGKVDGVPVSIIRGYSFDVADDASIRRLIRTGNRDLFR